MSANGNGTLPPHDDTAEAGVLACILCDEPDEAKRMLDGLSVDDFYDVRHREILETMTRIGRQGKPINTVSLAQDFRNSGRIEDVGGESYIAALPDQTPSPQNFPSFLEVVKDRRKRRAILHDVGHISQLAIDCSVPEQTLTNAFRRMAEGYGTGSDTTAQLLERAKFDPSIEPPSLRAIYKLAGQPVCTPGNLTTIASAIKTGKSAVIGAMAAATIPHAEAADLLSFQSSNPNSLGLLWFDSEQSPDDFWHCVHRSLRRVGLKQPPPWLLAFCLTGLGCKRAWECVLEEIRIASDRFGGLHSILLDGAADFVADVNDPEESNAFVATLHDLAIKNDCPIVNVIHFNPGGEKTRGHLGSQLERKAETNLSLEKDADEATVIYSTKNRRAGIAKNAGPRFAFSVEAGMHVSVESRQSSKDAVERETLIDLAANVFEARPSMRYSDLQATVKTLLTVSDKTAQRKVDRMRALAVIKQSVAGLYIPSSKIST